MKHFLLLFLFVLFPFYLYSQTKTIDSLSIELKKTNTEEEKIDLLNKIGWAYFMVDTEKYGEYAQKAYQKSLEINYTEGEIVSLSHLSWFYQLRGQIDKAFDYGIQSAKLLDSAKITTLQTRAWVYLVVGAIYDIQGQYEVAFPYYEKSLKLYKEDGDLLRASWVLQNLGAAYSDREEYKTSLDYNYQAKQIYEKLQDYSSIAMVCENIATDYMYLGNYDSAEYYVQKGLETIEIVKEKITKNSLLLIQTELYLLQNKNEQARDVLNQIAYFLENNYDINIALQYHRLATTYNEAVKEYEKALFHERQQQIYTDSINNLESQKDAARLQGNFEIERKVAQEKEEEEKKSQLLKEKIERQNMLIYTGITIILIVIIGFLYLLKTLNASENVLKAGLFFVLLLLFEFILLLLEPKIEVLSAGNILIKLIANLIIAFPIVPLHSWLEKKLMIIFIGKSKQENKTE
ncbi:tetratricopeptide repeat protein [Bernardetia sp. Wsw4-3y2]|uniref:tetratricopeptide repeat protein n=1 Tax=Bernardetia sp. Wsw4-3y2 TaxID=3127471 RepID=UPI0030CDCC51